MISLKEFINQDFTQHLQDTADAPEIKEIIDKFTPLGGLDPAIFLSICCKYVEEGRDPQSFTVSPIVHLIRNDLNTALTDIKIASENLMYSFDSKFESRFKENNNSWKRYIDDEPSHLSIAYHEALLEYKNKFPMLYFHREEDSCYGFSNYKSSRELYKLVEDKILQRLSDKLTST